MAQLLIVLLLIAMAIGAYRCGQDTSKDDVNAVEDMLPGSRLEEQLYQPRRVEEAMQEQVEKINERNRELLRQH